ncbi:MAG TPA: ATP-grasp domain-containing protein [Ktedonosporobacter sp.]|nr:ATP-grasp domain-containing protein [Ktedonosporobacter sp.]
MKEASNRISSTPGVVVSDAHPETYNVKYDALILDAKLRQSLVTVRSLGRRGKRVAALEVTNLLESSRHVPTFSSRWCQKAYIAPAYEQSAETFLSYLGQILAQAGARVLIPSSDGMLALLREQRELIEQQGTRIAIAKESALAIAINKEQTLEVAEKLGLGVPKGVMVTAVSEVGEAIREIGLPAVVKPTASWVWGETQGIRVVCQLVTTPDEARRAVEALTQHGGAVLFQQFLAGRNESVSLFYARGELYARFGQWSRRTHPPLGGVSTYRQSIEVPYDTGDQALRLVREIELEGYSQVQFRRDKDGKPYLMEINPRLTSGIEIAVRSGVDFPYLMYQWASGEHMERVEGYQVGGRMRYLEGDLLTTLRTFVEGGRPGVTPAPQALFEFVKDFFVPSGYDYMDREDPGPAWTAAQEFADHLGYWWSGRQAKRKVVSK